MYDMNKVIVSGHLGADPELRHTPSGIAVTDLSIATNRRIKVGEDAYEERTDWHRVTVWRRNAENACTYLRKGAAVLVEGHLRTDKWTDKSDQQKRRRVRIIADQVHFLPSSKGKAANSSPANAEVTDSAPPF